ncbi:LysR family transcriptional regulator [Streptomyces sp. NPDC090499]|uniref:LysR family transcriptional regulator n=1 Tax=Streptomyces sp. NPDC090499 TaxID=3365965 RepID=UPI0038148714
MVLSTHVPDLAALELLLGVAREGSLNGVARKAGVSQQAVSARIRAMERQTGVALVHRTPHGSTLTVEGVMIAEWAVRLLDVAADMDAGIAALRTGRHTRLRVSASSTISELLLPGWLASFRAEAPEGGNAPETVLTYANSATVITHVTEGIADIGFTEGPQQPPGLHGRAVGHDRLAVVVAPGHPWARRPRTVAAAELARTPLVSREAGSGTRDTFAAALTAVLGPGAEQAPPALSLSTTAAIRAAALAGAAPAVISELAVADDLADGRLVAVQTPELDLRRTLRAVWDGAASPPSGAARDLIAHILGRQTRQRRRARTRRRGTTAGSGS